MSNRVPPEGTATRITRQASSAKLLNARWRVASTSARCSLTLPGVERYSGKVHSNGSSQRFEVIPPKVCSIAAADRNTLSPTEASGFSVVSNEPNSACAGTAYRAATGVFSITAHDFACKRANSRSRHSTICRPPRVCALLLSSIA